MSENVFMNDSQHPFEMRRKASFTRIRTLREVPSIPAENNNSISNEKRDKLWKLMESYISTDTHSIQRGIVNHVEYTLAKTRFNFDINSCYRATACSVKDRLIELLNDTNACFHRNDVKRCYYLSLEFLLGRAMQNALANMDLEENYKIALKDLGFELEELYECEHDPALGNGGLGRLAACFLDSMATLCLPCWGYGIRYTYGIFEQKIINGRQVEHPDYWLVQNNPWEIERPDCTYAVRLYGHVKEYYCNEKKRQCYKWVDGEIVQAMAYDNPIIGFDSFNTINLRLWKACPSKEFDFHLFNIGKYLEAVKERQRADCITAVLYPNDNTDEGKELRLKQQYFFVCATIQDVLRRFKKKKNRSWSELPNKICLQLNDTHPTIAIPELMRILIDVECLQFKEAYDITRRCFNYTNHTVLPEALEKWSAGLIEKLLPRHLLIINDINFEFLNEVRAVWGDDWKKISNMSIYEEGPDKKIRMANLAVIGSAHVNGVAAIHTELVKRDLFPEFFEFYNAQGITNKFVNITNGVTPRRWIHIANRNLSDLISKYIGSDCWLKDLNMIASLHNHIEKKDFRDEWAKVKLSCKKKLADWVSKTCNVHVDPNNMLFDIQVKRIHEYKRQLLNCLYIIYRYLSIKKMNSKDREQVQPRACFIGGKAAPGYATAKSIIKLCNSISNVVNNDKDTEKYLKVVFLPNYNVSNAQVIIPASDISQHISTAGTEASGTSNMKFVLNGGLIVGTLDGANVEILQECGDKSIFIFGAKEQDVQRIRENARAGNYPIDSRLMEVFNFIRDGRLKADEKSEEEFNNIVNTLLENCNGYNGDYYLLCHDFPDYCRAQDNVDKTYQNPDLWWKLSIQAAGSMGKFSTDRTIKEYAEVIWNIKSFDRSMQPINNTMKPRSFANDNLKDNITNCKFNGTTNEKLEKHKSSDLKSDKKKREK